MKEISIQERRTILLDIMKKIKEICEINNIHYYLAYGTLLGAVRHKGFIPWDDDVDLWVNIDDYDILLEELIKDNTYEVINSVSDPHWTDAFSKVYDRRTLVVNNGNGNIEEKNITPRGVAVDLFPLFDLKDDSAMIVQRLFNSRRRFFWLKRGEYKGLKHFCLSLIDCCLPKGGEFYYRNKLNNYEHKHRDTPEIGLPLSPYGSKDRYKREWFNNNCSLLFEDESFAVPRDYEKILTTIYGDYMTLPPKEKREKLFHDVKAYWVDKE